ncbi:helix-turn-helix transcriptional regulator [Corynebacterium variabile]|uniref:helix-turn-helix transcriptional regulator n=1 Tax=Corynebacterium variabile TaxID=1727 RepID=UPI002FDF35AF
MAETSSRILRLLSLLQARAEWSGTDLADLLGVSSRTLRRDVDTLRGLDYPIHARKGPGGGYRLGAGSKLPPLVLDDDQAIAIAIALQTAPATIAGIDDSLARALNTLRQVMPARVQAVSEDFTVSSLRNYWEFSAPPIAVDALRAVGAAVRTRQILRFDYAPSDSGAPEWIEPQPPVRVEPHRLVVWAGRWYLVAYYLPHQRWSIYRVERIRPKTPAGPSFAPRPLPEGGLTRFITTTADRGDTVAEWPCVGHATLALPADVVARWAPGGSVVEELDRGKSRLTLGGWSWAGVAGLYATFDTDLSDIRPSALVEALGTIAHRFGHAACQHKDARS